MLLDELELPEPLDELDAAGFESDEDFAPEAGVDDDAEDAGDADAGELLDDEPRLSFR